MPVIRVGVQATQGSPGQVVDIDGLSATVATISNTSAEAIAYSRDGGTSWATIAAGASASVGAVSAGQLFMRKVASGAYPATVDVDLTAYGPAESDLGPADRAAVRSLVSEDVTIARSYTWATLPAAADYIGTAYISDVGLHGSLWRSDGATWGVVGGVVVLDRSAVALAAHTGTTALTTLLTKNLPANLPGLNGAYRLRGKLSMTNNANLKTFFAYIGGNAATGIGYTSTAGGGFEVWIENRGSAGSQIGSNGTTTGVASGTYTTGLAIQTDVAHTVSIRATLASAGDSLTVEAWHLELHRP